MIFLAVVVFLFGIVCLGYSLFAKNLDGLSGIDTLRAMCLLWGGIFSALGLVMLCAVLGVNP